MKVVKVKNKKSRERLEKKFLKKRKVLAVISDLKDLNSDFVKKADIVILDESFGKEGLSTLN